MSKKILFTDLDDTLLNNKKEVTAGNRAALAKMLEQGHEIVFSTGRPLVSALKQARALSFTGSSAMIAFNGAILYDLKKDQVINRCTLPLPLVYRIFDYANAKKIHVQTYSEDKVLVEPHNADYIVDSYNRKIGTEYQIIPDIRLLTREPEKVLVIDLHSHENLDDFIRDFPDELKAGIDLFFSNNAYLEIVPKGTNKGEALLKIADYMGVPAENTVAAGDASNDIPMLQAAGVGVAMKNASPDVLAAADVISEEDCNHDGVAGIIEKYILDPVQ